MKSKIRRKGSSNHWENEYNRDPENRKGTSVATDERSKKLKKKMRIFHAKKRKSYHDTQYSYLKSF